MAQQYQRHYSPYPQPTGSPMQTSPVGVAPPLPKRQRLSPNPASPYQQYAATSPYASQPGTPSASFSGLNPQTPLSFNQPELAQLPMGQQSFDAGPRQGPGSMGPPQRPAERLEKEKPTDINDLSDVIGASGIDLREEENYLAQTYQNQHQNSSFAASASTTSPAALSPNNSFTQFGQGSFGAYRAFQGAGPVSQPPVSQEAIEAEIEEKHKAAARALAENQQQELNNPFLKANSTRKRVGNIAYDQGVRVNVDGIYDRVAPRIKGTQAVGPDGTGIASVEAAALMDRNAPFQEILTLISLATKDRLRGVLEDAYGLSRGRRFGSHGVVPPEFSDIAVGDPNQQQQPATAVPNSVTRTSWDQPDSAVSPMTIPMKRPLDSFDPKPSTSRLPTPPTDTPPTPQPTTSFSSNITPVLKQLAAQERRFEKERLAKRNRRQDKAKAESSADGTDAALTPAELLAPAKMTKKERERIAKAGQTEEVLHKNANSTASLALGGGGKKYSWLSGGGGGGGGSGALTPSRINTSFGGGGGAAGRSGSVGVSGGGKGQAPVDAGLVSRDRKWGEWREDGEPGRGIQMRDLIAVLENDGGEKKTLARALLRLKGDS